MAPEVTMGKEYSGAAADLFAAGIILFNMVTSHPPFVQAIPSNDHYKTIYGNRPDLLWRIHGQNKPEGINFISDELKSLLSSLWQYDPIRRPSISEIKNHPWFDGETATKEEVHEEFMRRLEKIEEQNMQIDQPLTEADVDMDLVNQHTVHRGIEDIDVEDEKTEREEEEYIHRAKTHTQFFSTSSLEELFGVLVQYITTATKNYDFSKNSYEVEAIQSEVSFSKLLALYNFCNFPLSLLMH